MKYIKNIIYKNKMTIGEFKRFINKLPIEMDSYTVVNGEAKIGNDDEVMLMVNNTVYTVFIDKENQEMQILHQSDKDIKEMLSNGDR